jgi:hypothetical protein
MLLAMKHYRMFYVMETKTSVGDLRFHALNYMSNYFTTNCEHYLLMIPVTNMRELSSHGGCRGKSWSETTLASLFFKSESYFNILNEFRPCLGRDFVVPDRLVVCMFKSHKNIHTPVRAVLN